MFMKHACLTGNRGLLFEVGDAAEGLDLTEATPGYRWQLVPNASSPIGFWSKEGQPFRYVVGEVGVHIKSIVSGLGEARRQKVSDEISRVKCVTSTNFTTTELDHGSPPVVGMLVHHRLFIGACDSLISR